MSQKKEKEENHQKEQDSKNSAELFSETDVLKPSTEEENLGMETFSEYSWSEDAWKNLAKEDPDAPFKNREFGEEMVTEQGDTLPQAYRRYPRIFVEEHHAGRYGLKVLRSKRMILVTDMEITPEILNLQKAADAAYPQLCEYFRVPEDETWNFTAFLMSSNIPFMESGYLPGILPSFKDGFAFNYDCWLYDQPSNYYRQHLLLHEMVHCFMLTVLGKTGPLWMTEGYAEFFGMHDMSTEQVKLGFMPPNKEAVPYCARIRELREVVAAGRGRTFQEVFDMNYREFPNNEVYIWSWALMWFLNNHPDTSVPLRQLGCGLPQRSADGTQITQEFFASLGKNLSKIEKHWMMYVAALEYGFPLSPMLFDATQGVSLNSGEKKVVLVQADKGWQNTGVKVKKGDVIRLRALGNYKLSAPDEKTWSCEPGGISLSFYRGNPRGILLAAICPDEMLPEYFRECSSTSFFAPVSVGLHKVIEIPFSGTLMVQINDVPVNFPGNSGSLKVEIMQK
ncbi:MAG: LecA/PA-IL family lectin [Planctomycetia bacterium]|nr:LecA/PA-IL family lectin [Planctomycetia bacterium]